MQDYFHQPIEDKTRELMMDMIMMLLPDILKTGAGLLPSTVCGFSFPTSKKKLQHNSRDDDEICICVGIALRLRILCFHSVH